MWTEVTESLVLNKCSSCPLHKAVAQINKLILKRQLWFPCNNSTMKVQSFLMNFCSYCFCYCFYWYQGLAVTMSTSLWAALEHVFIIIIFDFPYFFVSAWESFPSLLSAALEKQPDVFTICRFWPCTLLFRYLALFIWGIMSIKALVMWKNYNFAVFGT